jgi:hypothetical protein
VKEESMSTGEWLIFLGSIGEFVIAGVIYYELEESRASTFLANVQNPDFLKDRRRLYAAYVDVAQSGTSLKARAEAFKNKIESDADLRSLCDLQWYNIDRLQYALRNSLLHSRLLAQWFPQTLVSLWVMTGLYVRDRQVTGPVDSHQHSINAVKQSLQTLASRAQKRGGRIGPITIRGAPNVPSVEIPEEMLKAMCQNIDAPFD